MYNSKSTEVNFELVSKETGFAIRLFIMDKGS